MANPFRKLYQHLLDSELARVGDELEKLASRHQDVQLQIVSFQARLERVLNRVQMRLTRAARGDGGDPLVEELERARATVRRRDFDDFDDIVDPKDRN